MGVRLDLWLKELALAIVSSALPCWADAGQGTLEAARKETQVASAVACGTYREPCLGPLPHLILPPQVPIFSHH